MDTYNPLPISVALDDADSPADVIDALLLGPFVAGHQPVARTVQLGRVKPGASLLPPGVEPVRVAVSDGRRAVLAEGSGWTLAATRWKDADATVTVVAETEDLAARVLEQAVAGACQQLADDGSRVAVSFWHRMGNGRARRTSREIEAPAWPTIRANYAASGASALEELMGLRPDGVAGRLVLLHGPPGTGKTTAIRAVAAAWRRWCRTEVVVDPERLYGDAAYLMAVLLGRDDDNEDGIEDLENPDPDHDHDGSENHEHDGGRPSRRWRLLVLEDCDELLRVDAKKESGQALGRLLNVTDGFIGQGLRLLVALTTNERLGELHPAIVRPGRCLAEVHVGRLSRAEAIRWLGSGSGQEVPADGATLAELFARRDATAPVRARELRRVSGAYL